MGEAAVACPRCGCTAVTKRGHDGAKRGAKPRRWCTGCGRYWTVGGKYLKRWPEPGRERTCLGCGVAFVPKQRRQVYHTKACALAAGSPARRVAAAKQRQVGARLAHRQRMRAHYGTTTRAGCPRCGSFQTMRHGQEGRTVGGARRRMQCGVCGKSWALNPLTREERGTVHRQKMQRMLADGSRVASGQGFHRPGGPARETAGFVALWSQFVEPGDS